MSDWRIRRAEPGDAADFHAVEEDAAQLLRSEPSLRGVTIPPSRSTEAYRELLRDRHSLLAAVEDRAVGIAAAHGYGADLHLHELSVATACQNQGIGAALLLAVVELARDEGFGAITLNTFRDIAWNAPFYARHGFAVVENIATYPRLAAALDAAVAVGLPRNRRCAMIRRVE